MGITLRHQPLELRPFPFLRGIFIFRRFSSPRADIDMLTRVGAG